MTAAPIAERGYATNGNPWWRAAQDEETPELQWPKCVEVYDAMRRQDAQVMSVLRAVTLPIRRTGWRIDPNGAREEVTRFVAENLGLPILGEVAARSTLRTRDRFDWGEHLRLALTMLPFGHAYFEQVYRIDGDGRARLRKLGWRPPRTIADVDVADDGGLQALRQHGVTTAEVRIPVEHLVVYVNDREGGQWLGQSLLRPAFKFWLLKDRALRTSSQTIDRNGLGVPIYTGPPPIEGLSGEEALAQQRRDLDDGMALAQAFRGGEDAGAALPHGATLELRGVSGKLPDADPFIRYCDEQIARAVLAHFLNLGTETGSWALGSTFADFFTLSLQTIAMQIADTATAHIVEDLVDHNYGPSEPAPRIAHDEIGSRHPATAQALLMLIQAGVLTPDEPLETFARTTYGLPAADLATRRSAPAAGSDPEQEAA